MFRRFVFDRSFVCRGDLCALRQNDPIHIKHSCPSSWYIESIESDAIRCDPSELGEMCVSGDLCGRENCVFGRFVWMSGDLCVEVQMNDSTL